MKNRMKILWKYYIYDISYKTLIHPKPLRIRFDQISGFIRIYDGTKYLTVFGSEKYNAIYNRTRYLISQKSGIKYIISQYFDLMILYLKKKDWLYIMLIHIKLVLNKDKNHYYYKIFLVKYFYQLAKK